MRLTANSWMLTALRIALACSCAALGACTSILHRALVEDRTPVPRGTILAPAPAPAPAPVAAPPAPEPVKTLPGIENAGKPGYYTVKTGDTLLRVGLETGQNWRDIQKWNNLDNPNMIEVGQVLRVFPPGQDPGAAVVRPVVAPKIEARPLEAKPAPVASSGAAAASGTMPAATPAAPAPVVAAAPVAAPPAPAPDAPKSGDDDIDWQWPANGSVISGFDEARHKGLSIGGRLGDPVLAAADGRVVYAGSGLRGYGNLVIIKHNNTFLTAYAHNQTLLVKEDQAVRRGQKIAEMGSSDSDRVQLHFEIRRQGKPIDPARLLPNR
jgi:lipoprotein NlpD